jgi:hypothetical protein
LARALNGVFGRQIKGLDLDAVVAAGRVLFEEKPRPPSEVGKLLHPQWPDYPAETLTHVVRYLTPLVQLPPRGVWGATMRATLAPAEQWLGRPLHPSPSLDEVVLRYLAAFGPASSSDVRAWSGIPGLRAVLERLRPQLMSYRDERGRELFDRPDAPLPDADTPAPVRFLPEFDNLVLGHDDRTRVVPAEHRHRNVGLVGRPTLLVDGFVSGWWSVVRGESTATLTIETFAPLSKHGEADVGDEGVQLLQFVAPDDNHDIQFVTTPQDGQR